MFIEDILQRLGEVDASLPIRVSDGTYVRNEFGSDRGNYYDMYIGYNTLSDKEDTIKTVGGMIDLLERAKKKGVMTGYKGGTYEINEWTSVTIGTEGLSGNEVCDTIIKNDAFYLVVGKYEFVELWHD